MDYKQMITDFANHGGDEKKMWASVAVTADAMDVLKELAPEKYDCFMRKMSETLYGKHYTEELARLDVSKMHSTDANGNKHTGAHWTIEEIESATSGMAFPKTTTKCDKYVAFNASWHDLNKVLPDEKILEAAHVFWFGDEDWDSDGKIWDYMMINK